MSVIDDAALAFREVNHSTERLLNLLVARSSEELVEIARKSGVRLTAIEARMKVIRRAYDSMGAITVPDPEQGGQDHE